MASGPIKSLKSLTKYLNNYAELEVEYLSNFPAQKIYSNSLLIPAYQEEPTFLLRLNTHLPEASGNVLIVIISNHPSGLAPKANESALSSHRLILDHLGSPVWQSGCLSLYSHQQNHDILLVDRTENNAIPTKQGVGLARKIGADLICALVSKKIIQSDWVMSSDADAHLPQNYFSINPDSSSSAITYRFKHLCDNSALGKATRLYEQSIKHYVQGLSFAGSDYAFSTLGSCLAFNVEHYSQARGFPKRAGGEDFYLLNKLAKLGTVVSSEDFPLIELQARQSSRVPFGTGPAVSKLLSSADLFKEPVFYNPEIFNQLKAALEFMRQWPQKPEYCSDSKGSMNELAIDALEELGIEAAFEHASRQKLTKKQYDLHIKSWFDGFKTLKFVHYLRDNVDSNGNGYPSLSNNQLGDFNF